MSDIRKGFLGNSRISVRFRNHRKRLDNLKFSGPAPLSQICQIAGLVGFEPTTNRLTADCAAIAPQTKIGNFYPKIVMTLPYPRPCAYACQSSALLAKALQCLLIDWILFAAYQSGALPTGFEPAIFSVTGKRVNRYSTGAIFSILVYLIVGLFLGVDFLYTRRAGLQWLSNYQWLG